MSCLVSCPTPKWSSSRAPRANAVGDEFVPARLRRTCARRAQAPRRVPPQADGRCVPRLQAVPLVYGRPPVRTGLDDVEVLLRATTEGSWVLRSYHWRLLRSPIDPGRVGGDTCSAEARRRRCSRQTSSSPVPARLECQGARCRTLMKRVGDREPHKTHLCPRLRAPVAPGQLPHCGRRPRKAPTMTRDEILFHPQGRSTPDDSWRSRLGRSSARHHRRLAGDLRSTGRHDAGALDSQVVHGGWSEEFSTEQVVRTAFSAVKMLVDHEVPPGSSRSAVSARVRYTSTSTAHGGTRSQAMIVWLPEVWCARWPGPYHRQRLHTPGGRGPSSLGRP